MRPSGRGRESRRVTMKLVGIQDEARERAAPMHAGLSWHFVSTSGVWGIPRAHS
jgi:hypothetical protein